jgi:hypothetical protein
MLFLMRACQRLGILGCLPAALRGGVEPLDEFAQEATTPITEKIPAAVAWWMASIAGTVLVAVVSSAFLAMFRNSSGPPQAFIAPAASPVEVEYPDYPGAPLLAPAVAAVPDRLHPDQADSIERRPRIERAAAIQPAPARAFDVRRPGPQVVSALAGGGATPVANMVTLEDAPPRRIEPAGHLAVTTLGGTSGSGRLALVLDVTEEGNVARVVSHEAVDIHPDVIDAVSAAALSWRYEPARRAGVPMPARVRVVVELSAR